MNQVTGTSIIAAVLLATVCRGGEDAGTSPGGYGEKVDSDIRQLRDATAGFRSVEHAIAAGYTQETGCVERQPEGAMGYHFTNAALRDGVVELLKPEVLVYGMRADGSFKLNGVEYIVPLDSWKSAEAPTIMGQPMKRFDKGGFWYLHAWIWEPSPSGLFSDWNPRVTCPKEAS